MKKKDLLPIVGVVIISAVLAFVVSNALFGSPKTRQQTAEKVSNISDQFTTPDEAYFNSDSVNPTQIIRIGGSGGGNTSPFGGN